MKRRVGRRLKKVIQSLMVIIITIDFIKFRCFSCQAPVPIKPWHGTRNAENFGTRCPTLDDLNGMTESERESGDLEDCLRMAVYSPNVSQFHTDE